MSLISSYCRRAAGSFRNPPLEAAEGYVLEKEPMQNLEPIEVRAIRITNL